MGTKMSNGIRVELTAEEQAEHDAAQASAQAALEVERDAKVIADAKLASGKQKLKDLGLDDDELKQILGI